MNDQKQSYFLRTGNAWNEIPLTRIDSVLAPCLTLGGIERLAA